MWRLGRVCGAMRRHQIAEANQRTGQGMTDQSEAGIVMTQSAEIENMNNEYVNCIHYHQLHSQLHPPWPIRILISSFSCVTVSSSTVNLVDWDGPSLLFSLVSWPIQLSGYCLLIKLAGYWATLSLSLLLIGLMTDSLAVASPPRPAITQTAIWKYISQFLISWTSEKLFWQLNL